MSRKSRGRGRAAGCLAAVVLIAGCASQRPASESEGLERFANLAPGGVDSLTPTLSWPAVAPPPGTSRVTYELQVWRVEGGYPVALVYGQDGLAEPRHTLTESLQPATEYAWTSRARLEIDGRVRLTDWRATYGTRFGVLPHPLYPRFRTPSD